MGQLQGHAQGHAQEHAQGHAQGRAQGEDRVVWILSEERPKVDALAAVLTRLAELAGLDATLGTLTVRPLVADDGRFTF